MYIEAVPNRGSPPAILLRQSRRENGRVRKRTLANLSDWPTTLVEGLRTLLRGGVAVTEEGIRIRRALPHGHAAAVLATIRAIGLDRLLGRPTDKRLAPLAIALIASRLVSPASKLATARDLAADTACSSLGRLLQLGAVDEVELYRALDWLGARRAAIETALARRHLKDGALVLYDVSSSWLEGRCCELARFGYSRDGKIGQAADRLRSVVCRRRVSGRDRGVRRQHRRPDDARHANRQAQAALRPVAGGAGRGPRDDHQRAHPRRAGAGRARLDHRASSPADPRARRRRCHPALAVRRA